MHIQGLDTRFCPFCGMECETEEIFLYCKEKSCGGHLRVIYKNHICPKEDKRRHIESFGDRWIDKERKIKYQEQL